MRGIRLKSVPGRILLAAALAWWPGSRAVGQAPANRSPSELEDGVDSGIRPGDDFFAFANGAWLRATTIPAGRDRWTARTEIGELTSRQVAKLLDDAATQPRGTLARKVADFRAAYLNEAAIEARGIASLRPQLDSIARVRDKAALTRFLARSVGADVDPLNWGIYRSAHLLGLSVEPGIHGEKTYLAFLVQGGLGLPDREYYVSTEPRMQAVRARYEAYIGRLLALAGLDRAAERARAVMTLETALAQGQATAEASASDHNADSVWTRADFPRQAPGMDWVAFLAAAGLGGQDSFVAWQPGALRSLAALVSSESLETWKDYLRFHLLHAAADVLPRDAAGEALALQAAVSGHPEGSSRAQRALDVTQLALSDALGRLYAERYFPAEQKRRVQAIVANVVAAFTQRVQGATWMSPGTKAQALTKLRTLYVGIGYPEHWQDYSDLVVDPQDAAGNLRRVDRRNYRLALARLGRPVDLTEWWMPPQRAGAILIFQQNAYDFSAALLQPPKYDPAASDAANYGAIGAVIGHDVSHFVDLLGAEYDTVGALRHWWTPEDLTRFQALVQPLVDQFSGYHPFPDVAVNGRTSQTENIADLAGLVAAFDAYRRTLGARAADREYVRQQDRQFFIGYARSWRGKLTEAALRTQLASDIHAPDQYRIATVRNLDAWYDAFDVRPGDQLYLAPESRVKIW
jgi:predicted metalloendopeptidase